MQEKKADTVVNVPVEPVVIIKPTKPVEKVSTPVVEKPAENINVSNTNPTSRPGSNCKVAVDDDEYLNLRKKMEKSQDNETQMLLMAHKLFEKKCFNTLQIKRLGILFKTDEGKYKLFDDAYNHTYDTELFPTLLSELTDEYYKRRFKAMLR